MKGLKGKPQPLGATSASSGVNFSLFSQNVSKVILSIESEGKTFEFPLDSKINRTGEVWHVFIEGLKPPFTYGYKLDGPQGSPHYFHPDYLLSDPYCKSVNSTEKWAFRKAKYQPKSAFLKPTEFDWQNISSPCFKMKDLIFYEMHVRGFTNHRSSGVENPGTFLGLIEKIPYLKDLGINAIKLMPIQEFNECEYQKDSPDSNLPLCNYWGYSTVNYFSPMNRYATHFQNSINEFKTLVRELHRNKIEVILDIVFNHTAEKSIEDGLYSFMGIDRSVYYMLEDGHHTNYSGCGHTMNLNHPVLREFVKDVLRYWASEMHVDGFRFDLASVMNRDPSGNLLDMSPLIEELSSDPLLNQTKLIAEPWDIDAYQLGGFCPQFKRWSEWNGKYRDSVRTFIQGDTNSKSDFVKSLGGSQDIFPMRGPSASINFVTAHDGFTLNDLVSYNEKHNRDNGEDNMDGSDQNLSCNMGEEGASKDPEITKLRDRQMKNFIVALMISKGVPMLSMGDEYGHTKNGNNNTWCQDNELNWFLWDKLNPLTDFVRHMIRFRKEHSVLQEDTFYQDKDIKWHGKNSESINWDKESPFISFTLLSPKKKHLFFAFNASSDPMTLSLPEIDSEKKWHRIVNTSSESPDDFLTPGNEKPVKSTNFLIEPFSSIILKKM